MSNVPKIHPGIYFGGRRTPNLQSTEYVVSTVNFGWRKLVTKLIEDLFLAGWDGILCDVKEKFGGLRFYITQNNKILSKLISEAGAESYKTCEMCGEPGKLYGGYWIKTLCAKCALDLKYFKHMELVNDRTTAKIRS
jgi:hypothetical protein